MKLRQSGFILTVFCLWISGEVQGMQGAVNNLTVKEYLDLAKMYIDQQPETIQSFETLIYRMRDDGFALKNGTIIQKWRDAVHSDKPLSFIDTCSRALELNMTEHNAEIKRNKEKLSVAQNPSSAPQAPHSAVPQKPKTLQYTVDNFVTEAERQIMASGYQKDPAGIIDKLCDGMLYEQQASPLSGASDYNESALGRIKEYLLSVAQKRNGSLSEHSTVAPSSAPQAQPFAVSPKPETVPYTMDEFFTAAKQHIMHSGYQNDPEGTVNRLCGGNFYDNRAMPLSGASDYKEATEAIMKLYFMDFIGEHNDEIKENRLLQQAVNLSSTGQEEQAAPQPVNDIGDSGNNRKYEQAAPQPVNYTVPETIIAGHQYAAKHGARIAQRLGESGIANVTLNDLQRHLPSDVISTHYLRGFVQAKLWGKSGSSGDRVSEMQKVPAIQDVPAKQEVPVVLAPRRFRR